MKLIAIDLDGTLLSEIGNISDENISAIRYAQSKGCIVTISSGRALHDTKHILQLAGIDCPIISGNGAIIFNLEKIIYKKILCKNAVKEIVSLISNEDVYFELYTNKGIMINNNGKSLLEVEIENLKKSNSKFPFEWAARMTELQFKQYGIKYISTFNDIDYSIEDVYKIYVTSFDQNKLNKVSSLIKNRSDISVTTSGWTRIEIAHPDASKGNALKELARHLKVSLNNTVAIGDNLNDLSMFKAAKISIAMGNASDEVKIQCNYITRTCQDNGVAFAIRNFLF